MIAVRKLKEMATSHKDEAVAYLIIGAIFFAMRSCEYLKTSHSEDSKRTRILRMRNIIFKGGGILLNHTNQHLDTADMVAITFEFQKNNIRNKTVHMFRTGDLVLCPVRAWAYTVRRIRDTIPGAGEDTQVCCYAEGDEIKFIDSNHVRSRIRGIVELIGEQALGFTKDDVGLHSIRSGGAMAMFLSGVSEIVIQRIGRWESFAFLDYIREQVENFTYGVSTRMLENEEFHHLNKVQYRLE